MGYPSINTDYCGDGSYNLSTRTLPIEWIVVHYTGTTASARNNCLYFRGGDRSASADWFIDDSGIYAFNPNVRSYYSWHCGGGTPIGTRVNSRAVGIEVVSSGEDFTATEIELLHALVRALMEDYGIDADHICRHYDCHAGHKACPYPYVPNGGDPSGSKWNELKALITSPIEEEDDMPAPADLWNYEIGEGEAGKNNLPAWQRLGYVNQDTAILRSMLTRTDDAGCGDGTSGDIYTRIAYIDKRVREDHEKIANIEALLTQINEKLNK